MSILACLIGILTLMISVMMQVKQMEREGRTKEEMDRALAYQDLTKKAELLKEETAKLEERLEKEKATAVQMAKLEERKIVLRMTLEGVEKKESDEESVAALQKLVENMKREIAALQRERPPLERRLENLRAEVEEAEELKPKESVVIRPGGIGSRTAKNLFFVECTSTGIVLRSGPAEGTAISTATIGTNETYNQLLDAVKRTRDSMVLFLIRKGGNDAYLWAASFAETRYEVTTGKLPIPNEGDIDLSLFRS